MTETNGAAFGVSDTQRDVDSFDLDAWITGAKLPERSVTVFGRPDLMGEYESLEAELTRLRSVETDDQPTDDRLTTRSPEGQIADRMHELRQEMQRSSLVFRFRSLAPGELEEVLEEAGKGSAPEEKTYRCLARQCVAPAGVTWQQMRDLNKRIGEGYFSATILTTAAAAREANAVTLPFSLAASVARSTENS